MAVPVLWAQMGEEMRRAHEPKWLYNSAGDVLCLAMGSDFCAEHEWGVERMQRKFACDDTLDGVARRTITKVPEDLRLIEEKQYLALFLNPYESFYKQPGEWIKTYLVRRGDEPITTAWDESQFGIVAYGEKDQKNLRTLWEAFQRKDVAFWPNIGAFHTGGGLIFAIVSNVAETEKKTMLDSDLDRKKLKKAAEDTGIEEKLRRAGKKFMALSPRWKGKENKTKYPVVFWLNPMDMDAKYGTFTVEELDQWAEGKGPVMKR